ncbi:MAG: 3-isopropylmalate dehydratase/homoaconitate hydratase family large subunit [Methanomicrobiales archaeon]|nr:3-isopropylmalate dehydratase/homoaconitate hydratase family large subunit [Methanomicrobiales archaeon]
MVGTLSERILGGLASSYVDREVDRAYVHDGTGVLTLETWRMMGEKGPVNPERLAIIFDHIAPANTSLTANLQAELREFARAHAIPFSEVGEGIAHQIMSEGRVLPGEIVVGADSHSCTLGAFGAFATGMGATDMAAIWTSGMTWLRVPATIAIELTGKLQEPAEAKDVALTYVSSLGMDGATYCTLEFIGDGAATLSMSDRLTLCNLSVEAGAKAGLFYADTTTLRYLRKYGVAAESQSPEECTYYREIPLDLSTIEPVVAVPPRVDTVKPVSALAGTPIHQVFVGTCTNGRYTDLERFARIVRGKQVVIRTLVVPASRSVLLEATRTGVLADLVTAGCTVGIPGCGPCLGAHMGVLGEGEICLSTANRNFTNRMGVGGGIYLCSVATAAASSLTGCITPPGES